MTAIPIDIEAYFYDSDDRVYSNRQMSDLFQTVSGDVSAALLARLEATSSQLNDHDFCVRIERAIPYLAEASRHSSPDSDDFRNNIRNVYGQTPELENLRNGWLYWLAVMGSEGALELWNELLANEPPSVRRGVVWAYAPLLKNENLTEAFLNQMLDSSICQPQLAGVALDLANFQVREGIRDSHSAESRLPQLMQMMAVVTGQLSQIEDGVAPEGMEPERISEVVNDSVAILISLCDFIGLCKYQDGEGRLRQVAGLRHRRLQTEANAALATLGIEDGKKQLVALAQDPAARVRAIRYAKELGFEDEISPEFRSSRALAESQMAMWLAEPQHMGVAPSRLEVVDERRWFWPGYDDPVDCFLIRFAYGEALQQYTNIGIVGPMTFAFDFNVTTLSLDDLYAAFAGWQAQHDDLYEVSMDDAYRIREREVQATLSLLEEQDFTDLAPQFLANFFGDWVMIANARLNGNRGTVIADDQQVHWFIDNAAESNAEFAYLVYRGRRLLSAFNAESE
ncbi:MAG: hypothetical protein R3C03_04875 [Pirellulaceae bacterium]